MSQLMNPNSVIEAIIHPDPYPYYRDLISERPFFYDETLKAWVGTGAKAVTAVLSHPACAVRPTSARVPPTLTGTTAGRIFQQLVRMNDGGKHTHLKAAVTQQTHSIPLHQLPEVSQHWAEKLLEARSAVNLNHFADDLPVYVLADLLGIPSDLTQTAVELVQTFALCLNPLNSSEQVGQGQAAAEDLYALVQQQTGTAFYDQLVEKTSRESATANVIGLMFQSYEATAGLIGNALQTLATYPAMCEALMQDSGLSKAFIREVIRWNPSVQNTRRYLTSDAVIAGENMAAEDVVIVVLAAANRDSQLNPDPAQFQLHRANPQSFTFGHGHHACLGEIIAINIVQAALKRVMELHAVSLIDPQATTYRRYSNLRIPNLITKQEALS
jgi:cytochrome P450